MVDALRDDLDECRREAGERLDALTQVIHFDRASIQLLNDDLRTMFVARGFREDESSRTLLRPLSSDSFVDRILRTGHPRCISDTSLEAEWKYHEATADIRSWIGAPIIHNQRSVGFLTLDFLALRPDLDVVAQSVSHFVTEVAAVVSRASLLDARRRLTRHMTIVTDIVKIIGEKLDTDELLEEIAKQVAEHLDCTHCTIFFPEKREGRLWLIPQHARGGGEVTKSREFRSDEGLAGWVFKNGTTLVVSNVYADSRFAPARVPNPSVERSMLVAPIKVGDRTIGVISADQDVEGWFSSSDATLVDALGRQAGIAIQRSLALALLQNIATRILTLTDRRDILEEVVRGAVELVHATTGVIYLFDPSKTTVEAQFSPPNFNHPPPRLDNPNGVTRRVIDSGRPVRLPSVRNDVHTNRALHGVYESLIAVPLLAPRPASSPADMKDDVIGVLFVDDEEEHRFTDTEESLLRTLASHAVIAIDKQRLLDDLQVRIRRHEQLEKQMERLYAIVTGPPTNLVDQVLDVVGEGIRDMFGEDVSPTINLLVPDSGDFEPPRVYGPLGDRLREPPRAVGGTARYVLRTKKPLYLSDVKSPPARVPTIRKTSVDLGVESFAAIPLFGSEQHLGVLFVNSQKQIAFSEHERRALESFAALASKAIENHRLPTAVAALRKTALDFFTSAGRKSARVVGPLQLRVPEPVRVTAAGIAHPHDVSGLEQLLSARQTGYFVFTGQNLPSGIEEALDDLRKRRNPVVPLSEAMMTAALADGNADVVLAGLEHDYRSSENLFEMRNALIDERFLFGRRHMLASVTEALLRGEHILLFGLRKSGKTSFLNILRQHFSKYPVSSIDLQRYDSHQEDWPPLLFQHIIASWDAWGRAAFAGDWPAQTSVAPTSATEFRAALVQRRQWQLQRRRAERLIIVLDEIERVFRSASESGIRRFVLTAAALRSLVQDVDEPFVSIIAADLRTDINRTNRLEEAGTNPFFQFFKETPLPLLTQPMLEQMIRSIARAMGLTEAKTVTSEFVDTLFAYTGGHPFLSRLLAAAAYRNEKALTAHSLRAGLAQSEDVNEPGAFFKENLWGELRPEERQLLLTHLQSPKRASKHARAMRDDKAALAALGLLKAGRIPIGLFEKWLRGVAPAEAQYRAIEGYSK